MAREVEIIVFVISTQRRAFSAKFCLTFTGITSSNSFAGRGLFEGVILEDLLQVHKYTPLMFAQAFVP